MFGAITQPQTTTVGSLFWFGVLVYVAPFLVAGVWMLRAQLRYVRLYRETVGQHVLSPEELGRRYAADPGGWLRDSPAVSWTLWRIVWERQRDAELEKARRRVVWRWWLVVGVMVVGAPIPVIFASLR